LTLVQTSFNNFILNSPFSPVRDRKPPNTSARNQLMADSGLQGRIKKCLDNNMPTYLDLLRQMVDINSFTANAAGVNRLGELTAKAFAELGFTAEFEQSVYADCGRHLILTRQGKFGRTVGFVSHLDTVFPPEEEIRNEFFWREVGDRIYGPGTVDIKGGTVLMYMVLEALQTFAPDIYDDITWVLLLDASEEANAEDFGALCRQRLGADETIACLVFEGGYSEGDEFWIVRARKGMAVYEVTVEGKAAHAGTSHKQGANAIVQMAHTIQQLAALTDYQREVTVNVGVVSGGTVTNRVPHRAQARLEMRTFEPAVYEAAMANIAALDGQSSVKSADGGYPCQVSVQLQRRTAPMPPNEGTDHLIEIWREAGKLHGFRIVNEYRGGLSDANHFWHHVPTLDGLGVSGGNAHCSERSENGSKDQEYCRVSSFVPKALLNVTGILKLIGENHP
jgi:glutamate carboxypeptidase